MALSKSSLYMLAWCTIAANPLFSDKWLCAETWYRLINARYPTLRYTGQDNAAVNRGQMTTALTTYYSSDAASDREPEWRLLWPHGSKHDDPYTGKPGRVHYFYYDSTEENMPTPPRSWRDVADPYAKSVQMVERRVQVVRNRNNAKEAEVERSIRALVDKKNKDGNERLIKARNAGSGGLDGMDEDDDDDEPNGEAVLNNRNHIGWLSSEARALFLGSKDADGDVVDILQERIGELTNVVQAVDDYKSVLQSADDDGAELNDHQKWHIAQKAIYLREAYKLKVVNSHRAALDHDRGYLDKIIKEECFDLVRFVVKSESKSLPVKREESSGETSRKSSRKRTKTSRG